MGTGAYDEDVKVKLKHAEETAKNIISEVGNNSKISKVRIGWKQMVVGSSYTCPYPTVEIIYFEKGDGDE